MGYRLAATTSMRKVVQKVGLEMVRLVVTVLPCPVLHQVAARRQAVHLPGLGGADCRGVGGGGHADSRQLSGQGRHRPTLE